MVPTMEAIRGGGGSVKVGTTGKVSALMSREIESSMTASSLPPPSTSVGLGSGGCPEPVRKVKKHCTGGRTHHIPMLAAADSTSLDGTPVRQKPNRKAPGLVEIVDIKCGNPEKAWMNPMTNRLKKLGFSRLSEGDS